MFIPRNLTAGLTAGSIDRGAWPWRAPSADA